MLDFTGIAIDSMDNWLESIVTLVGGVIQAQFPPFAPIGSQAGGAPLRAGIAVGIPSLDTRVNPAPFADTAGRSNAMRTRLFPTLLGAGIGLAVIAVPAHAANDIEATAQACAACHGQNGVPSDPKTVRSSGGRSRAISSSKCATTEMANATTRSCLQSPKALRRRTFARSRPISRPRVGLHKAQPLRPHRRPRASPSASHAISRIFRVGRRRRAWRASATNTSSRRCAVLPPMNGPTTAICRNSCKCSPTVSGMRLRAIYRICDVARRRHPNRPRRATFAARPILGPPASRIRTCSRYADNNFAKMRSRGHVPVGRLCLVEGEYLIDYRLNAARSYRTAHRLKHLHRTD